MRTGDSGSRTDVEVEHSFAKIPVREQIISVRARVKAVRERMVLNTRSRTDGTRSRTVDPCSRTGSVRVWGPTYTWTLESKVLVIVVYDEYFIFGRTEWRSSRRAPPTRTWWIPALAGWRADRTRGAALLPNLRMRPQHGERCGRYRAPSPDPPPPPVFRDTHTHTHDAQGGRTERHMYIGTACRLL